MVFPHAADVLECSVAMDTQFMPQGLLQEKTFCSLEQPHSSKESPVSFYFSGVLAELGHSEAADHKSEH